ncbi:MAG: T9SS type A sorting domain-containing protein, partial [Muribaculaceae bacterium]|nr:T9SS type A sorting domain-containing protein [Muribaculaceae bacterium]
GVEGIITNACGGWQLYPNPVGSAFTLHAPMIIGDVQIFSMDGQLVKVVKDVKDTTVKINVDELPQGVYIVNTLGVAKMMIKM